MEDLRARLLSHWDPLALEREVRQSQQERLLIRRAENGADERETRRQWYTGGATVSAR